MRHSSVREDLRRCAEEDAKRVSEGTKTRFSTGSASGLSMIGGGWHLTARAAPIRHAETTGTNNDTQRKDERMNRTDRPQTHSERLQEWGAAACRNGFSTCSSSTRPESMTSRPTAS